LENDLSLEGKWARCFKQIPIDFPPGWRDSKLSGSPPMGKLSRKREKGKLRENVGGKCGNGPPFNGIRRPQQKRLSDVFVIIVTPVPKPLPTAESTGGSQVL